MEEEDDFIADDEADISEDADEGGDEGIAGGGGDGGIAGGGAGGLGLSSSSWKCDRTEAERQARGTLFDQI